MITAHPRPIRRSLTVATLAGIAVWLHATPPTVDAQGAGVRPMTFLDMRQMKSVSSPTPSPDGKWLLYTLATPDWKEAKSQTDVYLVSMTQGVTSTKQMTFTKEKNETSPRWTRDGRAFFFLSNREAPENAAMRNQIFTMRPDGGEAQRVTDTKEGVRDYALTKDGRWLIYRTGKDGDEQLYRLPVTGIETATAEHLAKHDAGIGTWRIAPDDKRIYWVSADVLDKDEKERREKKFTVNIRNMETPSSSLHAVDLDTRTGKKLTDGTQYAATSFTISDDSKWVGFRGQSLNRYQRNITSESLYGDLYLLEVATGQVERLTDNVEVSEGAIGFSPDSQPVSYTHLTLPTKRIV